MTKHSSRAPSDPHSDAPVRILTLEEWSHLSRRDQKTLKGIFERLARREALARDPLAELRATRTVGERVADMIAVFGGSWTFILLFISFIGAWIWINVRLLGSAVAIDPFPFILLNLVLSMIAALQAPVIMMSQNRQTTRDRAAAEHDYAVNLRAEVEIRELHDKLDALREGQWLALVEQQREQIRLLEALNGRASGATPLPEE